MTVLNLGVIELPYASKDGETTGDVAEILESKYHVMEIFYEAHEEEIAGFLTDGLEGSLETLAMGQNVPLADAFKEGESKIDDLFKNFLLTGEIETLSEPGIPTKASLRRRSSRFKSGTAPGPRPSFIDTGLYESSFKSWVDAS